ncbi:osmoprotectant transport system permease protein [Bacilli bacterium PM5-3]|nr:osmoprotectant transport system permease protein [Bacilli bacterium PM5-3]MDH6603346.1 osmoprotectant transport system permease protein [Bacilli bacterium PM5-9]
MSEFLDKYGVMLMHAVITHTKFVVISVAIGFVIAFVFGIILSRFPKISAVVIPIISVFQTIPGLVFIGVLFIYTGIQDLTVIIALSIYAIFPILKNTYIGLITVDPNLKEAARGCGMSKMQILYKVELPLASASIVAGIRMSTIYTVSWAVLAAMIGLGGLGEFVYRGIETNNTELILGGAIPAALLAMLFGYAIDAIQTKLTPRGLKKE